MFSSHTQNLIRNDLANSCDIVSTFYHHWNAAFLCYFSNRERLYHSIELCLSIGSSGEPQVCSSNLVSWNVFVFWHLTFGFSFELNKDHGFLIYILNLHTFISFLLAQIHKHAKA